MPTHRIAEIWPVRNGRYFRILAIPGAITARPPGQLDLDFLWDFLAIAAYDRDADAAHAVPVVAAHLTGWQRPGDFDLVAENAGSPICAAWARQFTFGDSDA